jgi:hypothetical protein
MRNDQFELNDKDECALNYEVSDEEMEAAADECNRGYTYQTSAYNRCCR